MLVANAQLSKHRSTFTSPTTSRILLKYKPGHSTSFKNACEPNDNSEDAKDAFDLWLHVECPAKIDQTAIWEGGSAMHSCRKCCTRAHISGETVTL